MDSNVIKKIEELELTLCDKIIIKLFKRTFCKVYVGASKKIYEWGSK